MKRDMDIIRGLLLWMEQQKSGLFIYQMLPPMPDMESTIEHVQMLVSAGLIEQTSQKSFRISWTGHEFLENVRQDDIWNQTKVGASKVGSWSIKLLGEIASGLIRQKAIELGLPITV